MEVRKNDRGWFLWRNCGSSGYWRFWVLWDVNLKPPYPPFGALMWCSPWLKIDPVSLTEEDLSLQASDRSQRLEIGTMTLDNLQAMNTGLIPLRTLMPQLASLPPGTEVQIPETLLVPDPQVLTSDEYLWVYLLQGRIRITLTNKLPFTLGPNAKAAATTFTIKNDSTGDQIASPICFIPMVPYLKIVWKSIPAPWNAPLPWMDWFFNMQFRQGNL